MSVRKLLEYWKRYHTVFGKLIRGKGVGKPSKGEYWCSWRPFGKKIVVFRWSIVYGQGSLIPTLIESFEWADEMGFIPIVYWSTTENLLSDFFRQTDDNQWNYFYKQQLPELKDNTVLVAAINELYSSKGTKRKLHSKAFDRGYYELEQQDWREIFGRYHKYYAKFFRYNRDFSKELEREWANICQPGDRILGVMLREDFCIDRKLLAKGDALGVHPWVKRPEELLGDVREAMRDFNCDKIFLGTQFNDSVLLFKNTFGDDKVFTINRKRDSFDEYEKARITLSKTHADEETDYLNGNKHMPLDRDNHRGYLIEMIFCAQCTCLLGQECSGTRTSLILNGGTFEEYRMIPNKVELDLIYHGGDVSVKQRKTAE